MRRQLHLRPRVHMLQEGRHLPQVRRQVSCPPELHAHHVVGQNTASRTCHLSVWQCLTASRLVILCLQL